MAKKEIKKSKKAASKPVSTLAAHAEQAVKEYEHALDLLHRKEYAEAAARFTSVIENFRDEKEIADRCRLYLKVCAREQSEKVLPLKKLDDYYYQGILDVNRQRYDQALQHLDRALKMNPHDDRVLYVIASAQALKGDRDLALSSLRVAIEANPQNRVQAQQDPDFEGLREDDEFLDLVSPPKS